jgi:hypothetical protein
VLVYSHWVRGEAGVDSGPRTASPALFHWDPKSWSQDPWYFVESGWPLTGAPPLLKTRGYLGIDSARMLWKMI